MTDRPEPPNSDPLFPSPPLGEQERMVEAILFASDAPLTLEIVSFSIPSPEKRDLKFYVTLDVRAN